MRGVAYSVCIVLLAVLFSTSTFAAPTAPPFQMDGLGGSSKDSSNTDSSSDSASTSAEQKNLPPTPTLPESPSSTTSQSSSDSIAVDSSSSSLTSTSSFPWIIGIFVVLFLNFILLLIIVLSSSIHILKDKHPFLAFKYGKSKSPPPQYKNTPDAIQYTETFQKLEGYIKQYLNQYSYDQIKYVLLQEGFTAKEIEAVYLEVRKHAS